MAKKLAKKKASKKVIGTRTRQRKTSTNHDVETFQFVEGLPDVKRRMLNPDLYNKIEKTLNDCTPNKRSFIVDQKLRGTIIRVAKKDFPNMVVKSSTMKNDSTKAYVWREK